MKAAFLYNFTLFTEWPELPNNTLRICTLRADQIRGELAAYTDKRPHNATLVIEKITDIRKIRRCQAVFISEDDIQSAPEIFQATRDMPVLVVTEVTDFSIKDAMIVIKIENRRMIFEINLTAAKQAGLHLSSKLLVLAKKIY